MTDFAQQRHDAESRLTELRRESGAARLDGKKFNHAAIAEAENELEDTIGAEAEQVRRAREAEASRLAALHKTLSLEFTEKEAERLRLVGRAEKAASELVEALSCVLSVPDRRSLCCHAIAAHPPRPSSNGHEHFR